VLGGHGHGVDACDPDPLIAAERYHALESTDRSLHADHERRLVREQLVPLGVVPKLAQDGERRRVAALGPARRTDLVGHPNAGQLEHERIERHTHRVFAALGERQMH
jgi:hypothetical protein